MRTVEVIDRQRWEQERRAHAQDALFLSWEWCAIVSRVLGGEFLPLLAQYGEMRYLVPVFRGEPWSGSAEFSIGAIGYGGPYPMGPAAWSQLRMPEGLPSLIQIIENFLEASCSRVTLYPDERWCEVPELPCSVTHILPCRASEEELFEHVLTGNVRTAIRKAQKSGVTVRGLTFDELPAAHSLLVTTQRIVGAGYQTPMPLLEALFRIGEPAVRILGAFHSGDLIGMGVFLIGSQAFHLFNGWVREASALCGNQALVWEAIRESKRAGAISMNLGESHYPSLAKAKERWGATPVMVPRLNRGQLRQLIGGAEDADSIYHVRSA